MNGLPLGKGGPARRLAVVPDVNNVFVIAAGGPCQAANGGQGAQHAYTQDARRLRGHALLSLPLLPSALLLFCFPVYFSPADAVSSSSPRSLGSAPLGSPHPPPLRTATTPPLPARRLVTGPNCIRSAARLAIDDLSIHQRGDVESERERRSERGAREKKRLSSYL